MVQSFKMTKGTVSRPFASISSCEVAATVTSAVDVKYIIFLDLFVNGSVGADIES